MISFFYPVGTGVVFSLGQSNRSVMLLEYSGKAKCCTTFRLEPGPKLFLFLTASRSALEIDQTSVHWVQGAFFLGLKWQGLSPRANYNDRRLSAKSVPCFAERGCYVISLTNIPPRPYSRISRPKPLLFLPSSSSVELTRLSWPRSRPTTSQKMW
jgi:hypothetical protein